MKIDISNNNNNEIICCDQISYILSKEKKSLGVGHGNKLKGSINLKIKPRDPNY